jgi:hypothetical protein
MKKIFIVIVMGTFVSCSSGLTSGKKITKQELGNSWPFTVDEGIIGCENSAIYFETNGTKYPINHAAKSVYTTDINEIWLLDDELNKTEKIQI